MTRRRVIFTDPRTSKMYATPEFNGDKVDFEMLHGKQKFGDTCDLSWKEILQQRFEGVKTLKGFKTASDAAQMDYHSFLGVEVLPVQMIVNIADVIADEVYIYDDCGQIQPIEKNQLEESY